MKLRVARHTDNMSKIIQFYTEIIGLQILGRFTDHDGYDGVFLGLADMDWHFEFTTSDHSPEHQPDLDDVLVFYTPSQAKYTSIINNLTLAKQSTFVAKNPYWNAHGSCYFDPDNFPIVIVPPKPNA